jgi:hypothetical protein
LTVQLRRWLGTVALAPGLVLLFLVFFLLGDELGLRDTPAARTSFLVTAALAGLIGWSIARWRPVPRPWTLSVGVGFAMAFWLQVERPIELSPTVIGAVLVTWVAALSLCGVATNRLAARVPSIAVLFGAAATMLLVVVVPFLAVRLSMGADMAPWESMATWVPAGLTDGIPGVETPGRNALQIASMVGIVVMSGSSYVLGYMAGLRRTAAGFAPAAATA